MGLWKYVKKEPLNSDETTKNAFFGFEKGPHILDIADWFVQALMDYKIVHADDE